MRVYGGDRVQALGSAGGKQKVRYWVVDTVASEQVSPESTRYHVPFEA